jgi:D-alanyl-D-alanine dipeptidase
MTTTSARPVHLAFWIVSVALCSVASHAEPARQIPSPFVYLSEIEPSIQQDMRYATSNNFIGRPVDGYLTGACILTRDTALALQRVQRALADQGYSLKVYDCYRPLRGVADFKRWSGDGTAAATKGQFFPDFAKRDLFRLGFIASRSRHSHGNAVDVTIVQDRSSIPEYDAARPQTRCDAPAAERAPDNSLDFGTSFDCFDEKSQTASAVVPQAAKANRQLLVKAMSNEGFENYRKEWWHFELAGAATAEPFDFPIEPLSKPSLEATLPPAQIEGPHGGTPSGDDQLSACPLSEDETGLFTVDCNGKSINIRVLKDISERSHVGTIEGYEPQYLDSCNCELASGSDEEWCKVAYNKTSIQVFKGWVLFAALSNPKSGRKPYCKRAAR